MKTLYTCGDVRRRAFQLLLRVRRGQGDAQASRPLRHRRVADGGYEDALLLQILRYFHRQGLFADDEGHNRRLAPGFNAMLGKRRAEHTDIFLQASDALWLFLQKLQRCGRGGEIGGLLARREDKTASCILQIVDQESTAADVAALAR